MSNLRFFSPDELYQMKPETTSFTVEGLLPSRGLSLWTAKPKQGKSTLLRQLAVAVSKDEPFLGRKVEQGTVLLLALEEKPTEVQAHLKELCWAVDDPIYSLFGAVERVEALAGVKSAIQDHDDVKLVIIDPLYKFVGGLRDSNDYVQVNNAVEPLLELARNFNVHVAVAHHAKKRECEDIRDTILGSQALAAGADTLVYLKSGSGGIRLISTTQRYGDALPESQLTWDAETRSVSLGETTDGVREMSAETVRERIENGMLNFVRENPASIQAEILNAVHGNGTTKHDVFKRMVEDEMLLRSGEGVKGSPFLYSFPVLPYLAEPSVLLAA
jgi:hypothetical protein